MKKIIIICILSMIPLWMAAQEKGFTQIYSQFEDRPGVESVNISPKAFSVFLSSSDKDEKELFQKMQTLRILSVSKSHKSTADSLNDDVKKYVSRSGFDQVMKVKDTADKVYMYHKAGELVFLAESSSEISVIYILGTIDQSVMKAVMEGQISFK